MRTLALAAISAALLAATTATRRMSVWRSGLSNATLRLERPLTTTGAFFWSSHIVDSQTLTAAVSSSGARSCTLW